MASIAFARRLLLAVLLITLAAGAGLFWRGIELDSNLRALAPDYVQVPGLDQAVATLAADFERRLLLVLVSSDPDALAAADEFVDDWLARGELPATRVEGDVTDLVALLRNHRFALLDADARASIAGADREQMLALAQRQLYSLAGVPLLSFSEDPFGFVSDYAGQLAARLTPEAPATAITIALLLPGSGLGLDTAAAIEQSLLRLEAELKQTAPAVELLSTGIVRYSARAAETARTDINRITFGSLAGVALLLGFSLRSARALLLPLVSVSIGLGTAFVACQYLLPRMHVITLSFGASLIGVAVDYAIHYAYHSAAGHDRRPLIRALGLSLITSLLGFGALGLAGLAALQHVALFSAIGLCVSWLTVIALGGRLMGRRPPRPLRFLDRLAAWAAGALGRIAYGLAGVLAITAVLLATLDLLPQRDDPGVLFRPDPNLTALEARTREFNAQYEPGRYLIVSGPTEAAVTDNLQALRARLPAELPAPFGIDQLLPSPAEQKASYETLRPLYQTGSAALSVLTELGVSPERVAAEAAAFKAAEAAQLKPSQLLAALGPGVPPLWVEVAGNHYAFLLIKPGTPAAALEALAAASTDIHYVDTARDLGRSLAHQRSSVSALLLMAIVGVTAVLLTRYGIKAALLRLAPPLAAISATALLLAWHDGLNLFHVMGLFLVLGLGADYVIFSGEMAATGHSSLAAIGLSATTSLLSFGLLALSAVPVAQAFGSALLLGTSINLLGSFLLGGWLQRAQAKSTASTR